MLGPVRASSRDIMELGGAGGQYLGFGARVDFDWGGVGRVSGRYAA